jgi:hypothetical protein
MGPVILGYDSVNTKFFNCMAFQDADFNFLIQNKILYIANQYHWKFGTQHIKKKLTASMMVVFMFKILI